MEITDTPKIHEKEHYKFTPLLKIRQQDFFVNVCKVLNRRNQMTTIRVNVYDLSRINGIFRKSKLGIYHTSVVVGEEFEIYYGYYKYGCTGVDYARKINHLPSSMSGSLYSTYFIGKSVYTIDKLKRIAKQFSLREEWLSNRYNVLNHNCNSFSLAFCKEVLRLKCLRRFPVFVFKSEKFGNTLYNSFLKLFVDENNPPYFLNKNHLVRVPLKLTDQCKPH